MPARQAAESKILVDRKTRLAPGVYFAKVSESETVLYLSSAELPVPERSMFANWVDARREGPDIELGFGQRASTSDTLSAALFVFVSPENVAKAIYGENEQFLESLARRVKSERLDPGPSPKLPPQGERMAFHRASVVNMSFSGRDAEVRFYHVSPRALHDLRTGEIKKAAKGIVSPIVKIDLSIENLELLTRVLSQLVSKDTIPTHVLEREDI